MYLGLAFKVMLPDRTTTCDVMFVYVTMLQKFVVHLLGILLVTPNAHLPGYDVRTPGVPLPYID